MNDLATIVVLLDLDIFEKEIEAFQEVCRLAADEPEYEDLVVTLDNLNSTLEHILAIGKG